MRVIVIGDTHEPVSLRGYIDFICDTYTEFDCNHVVHIGDITENNGPSKYRSHTRCIVGQSEFDATLEKLSYWHGTFPQMDVCIGNHDDRPYRATEEYGVSSSWIKEYSEVWGTPGWNWQQKHIIDDVKYIHGSAFGGRKCPALDAAIYNGMSCVIGHRHSVAGYMWHCLEGKDIFGLSVGCGIDEDAHQFAYDKDTPRRPMIGCGVVIDGVQPYFVRMDKERYKYK